MMAEEFDLVSEIIRSNNLRRDDNHQLSIVKGKLQVEDREVGPDYTDMDQAIKLVGESDEAELKDLLGKAEGIQAPPRISRQNIRNRVFQGLTNVGLDPEKSSFVADLFVGDMNTEFGLLDFMAVMSPVDIIEGIRRFRGGSKLEGSLQAGMGFAEAAPYVGKAVKTLKEPIKSAVSSVAQPAREFIEKQGGGTRLGANDAENIIAQGVVALDDTINPKKNNAELRKLELPTDNKPGIIAFHGSGADFDEFKLVKIGTGEGNQAFGYGLYFTDLESIAKYYRDAMREERNLLHLDGKKLDSVFTADNEEKFGDYVTNNFPSSSHDNVYMVLDNLGQGLNSLEDADQLAFSLNTAQKQIYNQIKKDLSVPELSEGKMYKVSLAPKESELLDYDKMLIDQPKEMQKKVQKIVDILPFNKPAMDARNGNSFQEELTTQVEGSIKNLVTQKTLVMKGEMSEEVFNKTVKQDPFINLVFKKLFKQGEENQGFGINPLARTPQIASQIMDEFGIKGIKYKAGQGVGIRNIDENAKANNYVIFDEKAIKVLEKYGIVGPVALTSVASQQGETDG